MSASVAGFWSYVHQDNDAESGRILRLAQRIKDEYGLITGEELNLFTDNTGIEWGQEWNSRLDQALLETTFFIPIVTPRYLKSEACRAEILKFSGKAESLGATELLLPILYMWPSAFENADETDEVVALIKRTQWVNWTSLRLKDFASEEHRTGVLKLAARISEIVESAPLRSPETNAPNIGEDDEQPGILDLMAAGEEAIPAWAAALTQIGSELSQIDPLMRRTVDEIAESDKRGGGASGRLVAAKRLATDLEPHAQIVSQIGANFAKNSVAVNAGTLTLLQQIADGKFSPEEKPQIEEYFKTIEQVGAQTREASEMFSGFLAPLQTIPGSTKILRPSFKDLADGIRKIDDGLALFDDWISRIREIRDSDSWDA